MKKSLYFAICMALSAVIMLAVASCGYDEEDEIIPTTGTRATTTAETTITDDTTAEPTTMEDEPEHEHNTITVKKQLDFSEDFAIKQTIAKSVGYIPGYNGMRDVSAQTLLLDMGVGMNIANSLDNSTEGFASVNIEESLGIPKINKTLILRIRLCGFGAIRLPVAFGCHVDEKGVLDKAWLDRVEEVVDMIIGSNMYCILTPQNEYNWLMSDGEYDAMSKKYVSIIKQIAERFKNYDDHLLFQSFSEVRNSTGLTASQNDYDVINLLNQLFVKTVRASGKNNEVRHLVVTTYGSYCNTAELSKLKIPTDSVKDKLIVDIHFKYPPQFVGEVSGQTDEWGSDEDRKNLKTTLYFVNSFIQNMKKCPVIIGQFYCADKDNEPERAEYAQCLIATAYKYEMICFWYDEGVSVNELFDRNTGNYIHKELANALIRAIII